MFGFGEKWKVLSVTGDRVVLSNGKKLVPCVIRNGKVLTIKDHLPKKVLLEAERYLRERGLLGSDNPNLSDYA